MSDQRLDQRKLNMIKVKVIEIEKNNIIKKDPNDTIAETIRKYIELISASTFLQFFISSGIR